MRAPESQDFEQWRGTRARIFTEHAKGKDVIFDLHAAYGGSPKAVAELLGLRSPSAISRRFADAGLECTKRDPWTQTVGDLTVEDVGSLLLRQSQAREQRAYAELSPVFGEKPDPFASLVLVSDLHFGARGFDYPRWLRIVGWCKDNPKSGMAILGDVFDAPTAQGPGVQWGGVVVSWSLLRERLIEDLKPIASQVLFMLRGNHDERVARTTKVDICPVQGLCEQLGIAYMQKCGFAEVVVGDKSYLIYAHHGTGGGQLAGAVFNGLERLSNANPSADLVAVGHAHQVGTRVLMQRAVLPNGQVAEREVQLVAVGSFTRCLPGSYAASSGMRPAKLGATEVHLYAKHHTVHPYIPPSHLGR